MMVLSSKRQFLCWFEAAYFSSVFFLPFCGRKDHGMSFSRNGFSSLLFVCVCIFSTSFIWRICVDKTQNQRHNVSTLIFYLFIINIVRFNGFVVISAAGVCHRNNEKCECTASVIIVCTLDCVHALATLHTAHDLSDSPKINELYI